MPGIFKIFLSKLLQMERVWLILVAAMFTSVMSISDVYLQAIAGLIAAWISFVIWLRKPL